MPFNRFDLVLMNKYLTSAMFKVIILLSYILMVNTSHFQGGTITYKIVDTYGSKVSIMITQTYLYRWPLIYCDNSRILTKSTPNITSFTDYYSQLNCTSNCSTSGGYQPVPVRAYCTDYSSSMSISVTQRTDIVNITSDSYFTIAFQASAWRSLSLPTGGSASKSWSVSCTIDLRIRSDTGKLNTPPVSNMISPIYIPVGTRKSLIIPTIDADNDVVRCRFATTAQECGNVSPPNSLPNNTVIISSNCTLLITGANVGDWYAVTIQIEDFADSASTTPLSSVPVQFLINVYAKPNCTSTPTLYGPYNQTGTCQSIQVGRPYTIILYAENYCSSFGVTIKDIATLSFPIVIKSNIVQNTSTLYSVSLQWTPTADQIGSQILCAIAIDSENVQSDQYCITFIVSNSSVGTCPGEELQMTSKQDVITMKDIIQNTVVTTADSSGTLNDETSSAITEQIFDESSSSIDTLTSYITESFTVDLSIDTSSMTTDIIISTTTATPVSSNEWSWLLPLMAVLLPLLLLLCCLCLCCPPPNCLDFFCRKRDRDRSSPPPHYGIIRPNPRMYMVYRAFGNDYNNGSICGSSLSSSRSTKISNIQLDSLSLTPLRSINKKEKTVRWAYPSPRSFQTGLSPAEYMFGGKYVKPH